jgi:hypothetical protein
MSMFEQAARMKLRVAYKGQATVEDLWDLKVEVLDGLYQKLRSQQKDASGESLLTPARKDKALDLKIEIIKHIVGVKLAEKAAQQKKADLRMRTRRISEILAKKQDEALQGKSEDELRQLLAQMEAEAV